MNPIGDKNGKTVSMLTASTHTLESMYDSAHSSNSMMTWVLRFVGIFAVCFGLGSILQPLKVLADVLPFLGTLVGAGTGMFSVLSGMA